MRAANSHAASHTQSREPVKTAGAFWEAHARALAYVDVGCPRAQARRTRECLGDSGRQRDAPGGRRHDTRKPRVQEARQRICSHLPQVQVAAPRQRTEQAVVESVADQRKCVARKPWVAETEDQGQLIALERRWMRFASVIGVAVSFARRFRHHSDTRAISTEQTQENTLLRVNPKV